MEDHNNTPHTHDDHDCFDHAEYYEEYDGDHRYHGWTCSKCGALIQTG
tara:strand:+ start:218 stop:361 length:144 start_codon:yes stop_codon:yes gene_type:complete